MAAREKSSFTGCGCEGSAVGSDEVRRPRADVAASGGGRPCAGVGVVAQTDDRFCCEPEGAKLELARVGIQYVEKPEVRPESDCLVGERCEARDSSEGAELERWNEREEVLVYVCLLYTSPSPRDPD